jgi:Holliday junction resolvase RusA-like endonuclease
MIILTLPFPISVNAMYANRLKGRRKSDRYATWANAAGWDVKKQNQTPIRGYYHLTLSLFEDDNRRRDPGNFEKCVSDLLVNHNLIDDDSKCVSMTIERFQASKKYCQVQVKPSNGIPSA